MNLTSVVTARVPAELTKKISADVKLRRARGQRANSADVIRDALINYFETSPARPMVGAVVTGAHGH